MHHILSDPILASVPGSSLEFIYLSEVSGGIFRKYSHDLDAEKVQEGTEELLSLSDHIVAAGHFPGLLIPGASPEDGAREMRISTFGNGKHVSVTPAGPAAGNPAQRIGI